MDAAGHAVVEDSALPTMPSVDAEAEPDELMPDPPNETDGSADRPEGFGDAAAAHEGPDRRADDLPDMEPLDPLHAPAPPGVGDATSFAAPTSGEGYVRLLCEVDDGDLRIVGASVVDGPLIRPELTGHLAYQVLVHGRVVAAGAFDDLAHQRGIAPPDQPELGHSRARLETYQFTVRVPRPSSRSRIWPRWRSNSYGRRRPPSWPTTWPTPPERASRTPRPMPATNRHSSSPA
jgi:hypothetical protein